MGMPSGRRKFVGRAVLHVLRARTFRLVIDVVHTMPEGDAQREGSDRRDSYPLPRTGRPSSQGSTDRAEPPTPPGDPVFVGERVLLEERRVG
jgi:hypothetical protein